MARTAVSPVPRRRKAPAKSWTPKLVELKHDAAKAFPTSPKLKRLVAGLGSNAAADMLGVDRSQFSRMVRGVEGVSAELSRRISDVEYVLDRALHVMHADEVGPWLTSEEPLLGNRVPLNVLRREGAAPLTRVLDAIYAGALA